MPPLSGQELTNLAEQLADWRVVNEHHIEKAFLTADFKSALDFVSRIGAIAEQEGHHPDICFGWGKVNVTLFTHKIKGLTESDFILAAKIDEAFFNKA